MLNMSNLTNTPHEIAPANLMEVCMRHGARGIHMWNAKLCGLVCGSCGAELSWPVADGRDDVHGGHEADLNESKREVACQARGSSISLIATSLLD